MSVKSLSPIGRCDAHTIEAKVPGTISQVSECDSWTRAPSCIAQLVLEEHLHKRCAGIEAVELSGREMR